MMEILVALLGGYVLGSLPTGLIVVRLVAGTDIRKVGSGNIGTVNVYRVAGLGPSALVLAVDVLKGAVPVLLARAWGYTETVQVATGLATIVGHNWSLFLRFGGGKGIATSFGALLAISPFVGIVAAIVWGVVVGVTRYASLGSLVAVATVPLTMGWRREPTPHLVFGVVTLIFAVYRHRVNIARLFAGTELKVTDRPRGQ
jgi:acyl phosphate:glycerol-3-phosphate acyltransferase